MKGHYFGHMGLSSLVLLQSETQSVFVERRKPIVRIYVEKCFTTSLIPPSPLGEGESSAVSLKNLWLDLPVGHP
jgi:hypothetical protein